MEMVPYVVRSGDHLPLLAHKMGFDADTVWNDPKNADLKKLRGSPNILCVGDILYVPKTPPPKSWLPVKVGGSNSFVATVPTIPLSVSFAQGGKPIANADCVLHGMPPPNKFTTDGDGKLAVNVPIQVQLLVVEFPKVPLVRKLRIGHLDPATEPSGIAQRMQNLGYLAPRTDPSNEAALAQALAAFQKDNGLPTTGEVDADTQSALEKAHGC